jgi:hypothetical protein
MTVFRTIIISNDDQQKRKWIFAGRDGVQQEVEKSAEQGKFWK